MAGLGPLVGENLGAERAPIEVREDGVTQSVKIGDAVDFKVEDFVPFGVESGEPARLVGIVHPAGSEPTIAKATRSSISAFGIEYERGPTAASTPARCTEQRPRLPPSYRRKGRWGASLSAEGSTQRPGLPCALQ
jgi:hypothetical protein